MMLEKDLREPVEKWLWSNGFDVVHEFLLGGYCDMIGCKFSERTGRKIPHLLYTIAIELKLDDVAEVIRQSASNRCFVNEAYAAMPRTRCDKMREKTLMNFEIAHVGLLSVADEVRIVIPSKENCGLQKRLWRRRIPNPATHEKS